MQREIKQAYEEPRMSRQARWLWSATFLALNFTAVANAQTQIPAGTKAANAEETSVLTREIRHQLLVLPFYSAFDHISFTLDGPVVVLSGQVVRPTLKADAEASVKSLEGVRSVANRIEVLPVSTGDDELRNAIYHAIYENAVLARYGVPSIPSIHIIVKNGNVALEGTVESVEHKNLAATRAVGVANVQEVKNNLVVVAPASARQ
jgi:hyperosmotically inducible periplasmic protein